ncbi:MAG: ribbon-helix-helix protein, CopG family [Deltaproteobacteria bacterium]|nr:ribbon-helix-helix protein, CopG family [Deltaproteobacteria bacterium]
MSSPAQKTTLYLDSVEYRRLQRLAKAQGKTPTALVREAIAEFNANHSRRELPRSIGAARSGRRDLSERAEELLAGLGRRR